MAVEIANHTTAAAVGVCATRTLGALAETLRDHVDKLELGRSTRFDLAALRRLARYCNERGVDVVHVHGRWSFRLVALMKLLRMLPRTGLIAHDHYGDVEADPRFGVSYRVALALTQPVYVGVHPALTARASTGALRCRRALTIENAIDFDRFDAPRPARRGPPRGVMVSNVRPSKDILLALSALATIADLEWEMAIAGDVHGEYGARCRGAARELGLGDRVTFLGPQGDVAALLARSDFGLHSAATESGPLALLEFSAAALPFVSTRTGSVARRLADMGIEGFVPPGDPVALAAALRVLLSASAEERRERGERGRALARPVYDLEATMDAWYNAYREAAAR